MTFDEEHHQVAEGRVSRRSVLMASASIALAARLSSVKPALAKDDLDHEYFMELAIAQGKKAPMHPFGSVIVDLNTKKVVGEGFNLTATKNPTCHGEMVAMNNCPDVSTGFKWLDVCLYTTAEPCTMCISAIIFAGIPLLVYGTDIPFLKSQGYFQMPLRSAQMVEYAGKGPRIVAKVLEKECNELFVAAYKLRASFTGPLKTETW